MIQEIQGSGSRLQPEHWQSRISWFLQQRAAVRAAEISEQLGVEEPIARYCLEQLEHSGQVEVLRPIGRQADAEPDMDYYRWRRADDNRYCGQVELRRQHVATLRDLRIVMQESV